MKMKHLSDTANSLIERCAEILEVSSEALLEEFESAVELELEPQQGEYSKKLVEFCSSKALVTLCTHLDKTIQDGTFSRLTFDMMLSWENPSPTEEKAHSERRAKEKEDAKGGNQEQDDVPLFYSDLMPLLVDKEEHVGEEAFVWLGSQAPLAVDVVNARFAFEELTASTSNRLHFPAYERFLKEMHSCIMYLQKQETPNGIELAEDEVILHVDGTAKTQKVMRHIGSTSWPGRLTLTNHALYFEASNAITYENALKIDLSNKDVDHKVSATSTGPWGAPIYDKAMLYESSLLSDPLVLEFPEMTSSTRRDHWLALTKEIILLHQFLSKMNIESRLQAWEMHSRTILGVVRLHAARELQKISPPTAKKFLIFSLFNELPKGDYVIEELCNAIKRMNSVHPCSTSSFLKSLNWSNSSVSSIYFKEGLESTSDSTVEDLASLESTIDQVREEAREVVIAEASAERIKEEGITDAVLVLCELLSPLKQVPTCLQRILSWEKPSDTAIVLFILLLVIYKEWMGYAIAALLLCGVGVMLWARMEMIRDRCSEIVVDTSSDQTTIENIISAQYELKKIRAIVQDTNVAILKVWSLFVSKTPKHSDQVMLAMVGAALFLALVPLKFVIMVATLHCFTVKTKMRKSRPNDQNGNRRTKEWWNSIPVIPIRLVNRKAA